jgi:NADPH:quinone reductase
MRKVVAESLESIADYRLVDVPQPVPAAGEVLVQVGVCGVGYVDALVALGRYQVKPPLPHTPGREVSGRIVAVGEGAGAVAVGDRVMAVVNGGFAEFAVAAAADVWQIADSMSFAEAAGFRINYVTALHALRDRARVAPGDTVVVLGAAGGLGAAGLQVARLLGARVVAAASSEEKRLWCRRLGADEVLDTAVDGWRQRLREVLQGRAPDVVFDPVCGPLFEPAFRSLGWRGRHLVLGFAGGPIPALPANLPLMKGAALVGVDVRQFFEYEAEHARNLQHELLDWVRNNRLSPPVGRAFALTEYAEALEFALTGRGLGKTVVEVAEV